VYGLKENFEKNKSMKIVHYLLVIIQFVGIFFFIFSGNLFPTNLTVFLIELTATIIGVWATVSMKLHTISVMPSVKPGGQLCTSGPYRIIRHPMYTAVLLLLLALLLNDYSVLGLIVFGIVIIDLIIKMSIEEKILIVHYDDYKDYMLKTKRIIPFVY
jgi:protein-S-isoprenylcysteine O-methyltransferase Ste14